MKWEKIKRLCVATKTVDIAHHMESGDTWIGNGYALYRVDDGIEVNARNAAAMLDLDDKQREGMRIGWRTVEDPRYDSTVCETEEFEGLYPGPVYNYKGGDVLLLKQMGLVAGIDKALLSPVFDKYYMEYRVRRLPGKDALIAVHNNMMCCALIMPMEAEAINIILADMAAWGCYDALDVGGDRPDDAPGDDAGQLSMDEGLEAADA